MHQVTSTVEKTLAQNQRLSSELKNFVNKNKELNAKVKTLQAMMEKVRNCAFLSAAIHLLILLHLIIILNTPVPLFLLPEKHQCTGKVQI